MAPQKKEQVSLSNLNIKRARVIWQAQLTPKRQPHHQPAPLFAATEAEELAGLLWQLLRL